MRIKTIGSSTTRRRSLAAGALILFVAAVAEASAAETRAAPPRPNIVYILADDLGWGDVGWHGGEIKTPNLDKLAAAGARLEQFYVQPVCSPTRAALMTGRYPMRHGLQVGVVRPWAQYGLPLEERTLPQALKEAGYETAIVGKWHLGPLPARVPADPPRLRPPVRPLQRRARLLHPRPRRRLRLAPRRPRVPRRGLHARTCSAARPRAGSREHDTAKPLFLYVPFNAVHAPHQVPEKYTEPYAAPARSRGGPTPGCSRRWTRRSARSSRRSTRRGMPQGHADPLLQRQRRPGPGPRDEQRPASRRQGDALRGRRARAGVRDLGRARSSPAASCRRPLHVVDWYPDAAEARRGVRWSRSCRSTAATPGRRSPRASRRRTTRSC